MSRGLRRNVLFALAMIVATGTSGCKDSPTEPRRMVRPEPSLLPPPSNNPAANYVADATVLAAGGSGQPCGWGTAVGETRAGVGWRVAVEGESISLDEDISNFPTSEAHEVLLWGPPDNEARVERSWRGRRL